MINKIRAVIIILVSIMTTGGKEQPFVLKESTAQADLFLSEPDSSTQMTPIMDLVGGTYYGFPGGLYAGSDQIPSDHNADGVKIANTVVPLNKIGAVDYITGKIILLSIGMSNTASEFCSESGAPPCTDGSFIIAAMKDSTVDSKYLAIINGATPGKGADSWTLSNSYAYNEVRDLRLAPAGLTEMQVEVVWLKVVNDNPVISLPNTHADAQQLVRQYGNIVRSLKKRYKNIKMVFFSSRIYGGYATTTLSPEPYAYESGFAVKWTIDAQINQMRYGTMDARAGNLNYTTVAPWIAWGPYLWADGLNPRSDGLIWAQPDFESDGTHPSLSGRTKVVSMLFSFFKASKQTRCWFLSAHPC